MLPRVRRAIGSYEDAVLALEPSLYWALDATSGATDLSGNGNDGTGAGSISIGGFSDSGVRGYTTSTDFDDTDDRITSSYSPFANDTALSFCGWAYRDAQGTLDTLIGSSGAAGNYVRISLGAPNDSVSVTIDGNSTAAI